MAASTPPAAAAAAFDPLRTARRSASANAGSTQAATRSKCPSRWTATKGDRPKRTAASTDARRWRVMSQASAYIVARLANTYAISSRFCAATTGTGFNSVAATIAGSAVCGWFAMVVPKGAKR